MKYSDQIADWLVELGYTTCFFVGGGHCMHLVESLSRKLKGIPVVHEVAAGIAAEYFNVVADGKEKALALVTSGPGLTNIVTAIAGAWLESRELLVLGGQVKTCDLSQGMLRQRGIQELCGSQIVEPITVKSTSLLKPVDKDEFVKLTQLETNTRKGPIFLEIPLDIQGCNFESKINTEARNLMSIRRLPDESQKIEEAVRILSHSKRPVILLGAGISREKAFEIADRNLFSNIPVMTTYNGSDRIDSIHPNYFGRPNTWGMRYSNLIIQQSDCVLALGTRLGLQQTGFNWQEFVPHGNVIQIDFDPNETNKNHPRLALGLNCDADYAAEKILTQLSSNSIEWIKYCKDVKDKLPLSESSNKTDVGYISPYDFYLQLSYICNNNDLIIPCSSGGAFTVAYQTFQQKRGQFMISNKSLASMGYGLSGAIGASIAGNSRRTILIEGDGGFSQNLQELGTVAINQLNLKIFVFDDQGYASIRMTQSNYFDGRYVGCDTKTGLGLPNFDMLFDVWGIDTHRLMPGFNCSEKFLELFNNNKPTAFVVPVDPNQTYYPKINSKITDKGTMISSPLHEMSPVLDKYLKNQIQKFI